MKGFDLRHDTPREVIHELTYANYRYNRQRSPEITLEQWKQVYREVDAMERRYQQERQNV